MFHRFLFVGLLTWAAASLAIAGPPLICHPQNIGAAKSLPWKTDGSNKWDNPDPSYPVRQLSADTLRLLQPETPVMVRVETLRRAAIYGQQEHAAAAELLAALRQRMTSRPEAMAAFDYGCFLAALQQMKWWYKADLTGGVDGSGYVKTAANLSNDPAIPQVLNLIQSFR